MLLSGNFPPIKDILHAILLYLCDVKDIIHWSQTNSHFWRVLMKLYEKLPLCAKKQTVEKFIIDLCNLFWVKATIRVQCNVMGHYVKGEVIKATFEKNRKYEEGRGPHKDHIGKASKRKITPWMEGKNITFHFGQIKRIYGPEIIYTIKNADLSIKKEFLFQSY